MNGEQAPLEQVAERNLALRTLADLPEALRRLWQEYRRQGARAAAQYAFDHVTRLVTGAPPRFFSRVTPQLYVGGQYSARGWSRLRARGITAVVNLRDEFDDAEAGIAPAAYLYLPTVDNTPPRIDDLCRGIRFMQQEIAGGGRVYVHCMLGVGRSATMVAAYLVHQGMSPVEAWRTIRRARPFIQPTAGQMALIEDFAQTRPDCSPPFIPI
ncbi:MAG: dual specificity protein phosphatase family protein [Caldilineaceae bacterium]|nr:dual specificity protein phosphatase family protein [Caldilineaceae bacterium]